MHREDISKFLLYIEPKKQEKLLLPINDEWVELMKESFSKSKKGIANYSNLDEEAYFEKDNAWRGSHSTACGERSSNQDFLLENGMITNSLCVFYLTWYRNSIPESEWNKLKLLKEFYTIK